MNNVKQLVLLLLCPFIGLTAKSQGINFEKSLDWKQIRIKAKQENKYILLDAYTTWCGPCKAMSNDVFPNKELGDFINGKFISVKIQMDQTKEDNESVKKWYADAQSIGQKYKVTAYPTILFFSPDGKPAGRSVGYKDSKALIVEARNAIGNAEEFKSLFAQYTTGKRDSGFVKKLIAMGQKTGQIEFTEKTLRQYIGSLNERELFKKDNLLFVRKFTTSSKENGFWLFARNAIKVNEILGMNVVENFVKDIISPEITSVLFKKDQKPDLEKLQKSIVAKYGDVATFALWDNIAFYYSKIGDVKGLVKARTKTIELCASSISNFTLALDSWLIFEKANPEDRESLSTGLAWSGKIVKEDPDNAPNLDTYANLLYKLGRRDEAIGWQEKAVKLKEKEKAADLKLYTDALEKMKAGIKTWAEEDTKQ